ncbi:MAG: class I SAM-dependent rRNA methyltransferase [Desulfobacterium sp.]|nr:class I SAM-dependent rRNA methyltransferase [Desulfobacterium sp.]MBU3949850.1 class I SAM-dependent rRNA methyltransferase [Pseudomonadota bacterium]MBU4009458.1 class I SAM-dependent rRNA methyltransferase [Pseudomonadota bacterium]MBU4037823.1 class I SAM-dependent rRNA methyltransferase [Pseudomonadota bacterium]
MTSDQRVTISKRATERVKAGHLWIYRSDIIDCQAEGGLVVSLYDNKDKFYGKAFYSNKSQIALRLITTQNDKIDRDFWQNRIKIALDLRQKVVSDTEVCRLINSEGDGFPSVIVDRYKDVLSLQTLSQGSDKIKMLIAEILIKLVNPVSIIERNDGKVRELEGLPRQNLILKGPDPDEIICAENGLKFYFHPLSGQKTGAFLDQRENRMWARNYSFGSGLDCFCYSGGFALNMAQNCCQVEALDISKDAIDLSKKNALLNGIENILFEADNVFDRLKLYDSQKKKFDTIVLDPPAFAKSRSHVQAAVRGYKEINFRALRMLNPGGILITASCSQHIDEFAFLNILTRAASDAGRKVQVIQKRTQSQDHPFLLSMPETYYLKCVFLRVL